ncbi:phosphate acyltransferase PlsX [Parvularcula sp. LCG005]|uniref:phosphate acyltransferase PlsX n=1 Tax=Parvularcula sp. LCG005 TaxID=3078805 RepID=UPI002943A42A|nr:phosphate acyltransferase PlsX [Parvularcula sp. LCG005]WOI54091.1 phosphate acyltransferase PlsX [Parvularcula sp. LCG005]
MTDPSSDNRPAVRLAIDAMSGDGGVTAVVDGLALARRSGVDAHVILHGREDDLKPLVEAKGQALGAVSIVHADDIITMDDKPTGALRRGRNSSMWSAIAAVKAREADAVISAGNTGALMAMSKLQLRMIEGVDRPAITAVWPTRTGRSVVLDVGANVEVNAKQLVQFAIMGEAYFRALTGEAKPKVGLLNVGAEEQKGHELIRLAATTLREAETGMNFRGFVEGDDIGKGVVDVIVTDGFTGNIALKTAEGTARQMGTWLKESLTENLLSKLGALLLMGSLKKLRARMNASNFNGAPLLGLNGIVIKSHGSADAEGMCSAIRVAENLAKHPFQDEIARTVDEVETRTAERVAREEAALSAVAE